MRHASFIRRAPFLRHRAAWVGLALLGVMSCFNPNLDTAHYACDPALLGTDCPQGFYCAAGMCQRPADATLTMSLDLARRHPDDLRTTRDLAVVPDQSTSPDLLVPQPCALDNAPVEVAANVYACSGSFAAGKFATLCATGFHPCELGDLGVNFADRCRTLSSFFAAQIDAGVYTLDLNVDARCPGDVGDRAALIGCGAGVGVEVVASDVTCAGLPDALPCAAGAASWICTTSLTDAAHLVGTGGILCCKG